jgi:protein TonB
MTGFFKCVSSAIFVAVGSLCAVVQSSAQEDTKTQPVPVSYRAYADMTGCKPIWPKASLRNKETGAVTMAFFVGADGNLLDSKIVKSSGFRDLDNAAHTGLRGCTFHAATENDTPVESWITLQYVWKIE